jgi:flagellar hook-length control protein FliK
MRVGVHPDGMGPIEIRAVMHGDQLGASISAQQADTHQWLVSHVNELAQTLNAHDLRVSNLSISDSPAGNSAQSGFGQPDTQGQGYQRNQPALQRETPEPESNTEIEDRPTGQTYSRAGVDLRA